MSWGKIPLLLFLLLCSASWSMAATYTACREQICTMITVPDQVLPGEAFEVLVEGYLEDATAWDVTAYGFYQDAPWSYDDQGMFHTYSEPIDVKGFNWGGSVKKAYSLVLDPGEYTFTFIFGYRGWQHGYYDVAIDAPVKVAQQALEVPFDIKPQSCPNPLNAVKKGLVSAALTGSETFDVSQVDISSLRVAGVAPIHVAFEDVTAPYYPVSGKEGELDCSDAGPDGYLDLVFKFRAQELYAALEAMQGRSLKDREVLVVPLRGALEDDAAPQPIMGEDVVRILRKK
ncbi:MAG: hypothetical protein C0624_04905 [Desulfuromonas sp.]|nr:MAG: hypothetical protein C0624_04905 [Desulfuromonas sp.]